MSSEEAKQLKEEFRKICRKITDEKTRSRLIENEMNTRVVLIHPFLDAMGYDARNPHLVDAEFTADIGIKKGEKADLAIRHEDDTLVMIIEIKPLGTILSEQHTDQLRRYYQTTETKIGVLTNGQHYRLYLDTDKPNIMDDDPYLEFDICNPRDDVLEELPKYRMDQILHSLGNISEDARWFKYRNQAEQLLTDEFGNPSEEFVELFARRLSPGGRLTKQRMAYFKPIVQEASNEVLRKRVDARLAKALATNADEKAPRTDGKERSGYTAGELEALSIFKGIACPEVSADRLEIKRSGKRTVIAIDAKNKPWVANIAFPSGGKCFVDIRTESGPNGSFWGHCRPLEGIAGPADLFRHASAIKQAILCYQ